MKTLLLTILLGVVPFLLACEEEINPGKLPRIEFGSPLEIFGSENAVLPLAVQGGVVQMPDKPLSPLRSDQRGDYYGFRFTLKYTPADEIPKHGELFLERRVYANADKQNRPLLVDRLPIHKLPPNGGSFQISVREWRVPPNASYTTLDLIYSIRNLKQVRLSRIQIAYCLPCVLVYRCRMQNGSYRPYNCEFQFRRLTVLKPDGTPMTTWQMSTDRLEISLSQATTTEPAGSGGTRYTFPFRATFMRVAAPAFPPRAGYMMGYSWLMAPLNTPNPDGTLAEYRRVVTGLALPMAIGESTDVNFSMSVLFVDGSPRQPPAFFAIENDSTTTRITGAPAYMSDKAEAYALPSVRFVP